MIKLVIFDMDGTLLESMAIWRYAGARFVERQGKKPDEGLYKTLLTMKMREGAQYIKENYNIDMTAADIEADIRAHLVTDYDGVQTKPGARELLESLRKEGITTALATASPDEIVTRALELTKLTEYFDMIYPGINKTTPDIFFEISQKAGALPRETLVAEDALYAITTAKQAGFGTLGVYDEFSVSRQTAIKEMSDLYYLSFENTDGIIKDIKKL